MLTEFYTVTGNRPVRLSEDTRRLALRALDAEFGLDIKANLPVNMEEIQGFKQLPRLEQYTLCIEQIASQAPLRILSKKLAGSASLDLASFHFLPATYHGEPVFSSLSHLTCGFDRILKTGYRGVRMQIKERLKTATEEEKLFLHSMLRCLDAAGVFHQRYLDNIKGLMETADEKNRGEYEELYHNLKNVPEHPPKSFREAVQSLWFQFAFVRLCGNWPGIGRIDSMLGEYLKNDLKQGVITLDEARETIAHFFIMGCEWIKGEFCWGSGDAQHYQNLVLSGCDSDGNLIYNEVTDLVLEVVEEMSISDFPISVRLNKDTPDRLYRKIADVMKHGCGVVAVYHEDICIRALEKIGYPLCDARKFANDGCWEIQVPGETNFSYHSVNFLGLFQEQVLGVVGEGTSKDYDSFEELYEAYEMAVQSWTANYVTNTNLDQDYHTPGSLMAVFTAGCIENARDYLDNGPHYVMKSIHAGGFPDVSNSLLAIKELVYDKKMLTLAELLTILRNNWEGNEYLRQYALNKITYFGNDDDKADTMFRRVYDSFCHAVSLYPKKGNVFVTPGISTFGREIEWRYTHGATAFGARQGDILASNLAPTPGTDKAGVTAVIKSACKCVMTKMSGSTALHIRLLPSSVRGEDGTQAIISLLRGFYQLGGFFLQLDVIDGSELQKAQENPEAYRNLSVRVSGWSARFITLTKPWQDMIIARNSQGL
ncbi:MAG: hypothetical protein BGN88_01260 [Clostridiales bacterium 43-6]|nr:MAG: hypothetical protein BGN88_01260 [Clostridiales bacterium 43-6]